MTRAEKAEAEEANRETKTVDQEENVGERQSGRGLWMTTAL